MKTFKLPFAFILLLFAMGNLNAQNDVKTLIDQFSSTDWEIVLKTKENLENMEGDAIPSIISLLSQDNIVKLKNTGTLIYPGAEKFYGHGLIVDYDIDNLSIRAGWLLESISFQNFGFSGYHERDENLVSFIKITFPEYYNNATNRKQIETSTALELRRLIHKLSIKQVNEWWATNGKGWTRLQALVIGLQSFDEKRQVNALFYMRNGNSKCTGLTKDYYIENIAKEIVRLSSSETKRVAEHARLILSDTQYVWLDMKKVD